MKKKHFYTLKDSKSANKNHTSDSDVPDSNPQGEDED